MNFQLAGPGRSFKGSFAYYLHDKRPDENSPHPTTNERVAWMEVRNLAHDDPAYVQGVMIATARSAEALKIEAGGSRAGRKSNGKDVFSYSIQWHPEKETIPDRAGMIEIAEQTLKVLGAENRQAAIICHTDTAHPHIHIVVNRVDPTNGKRLDLDRNADRLDEWAYRYERERGQIVSPNRDEKYQKRQRQEQEAGKAPPPDIAAEPVKPAPEAVPAFAKVAAVKQPPAPALPAQPAQPQPAKSPAAKLAEEAAAQKERHKLEWSQLAAANKERRSAVYAERIDFKAIAAAHRAETRPQWSELGKSLAAERKAFRSREKAFVGLVQNAVALATIRIGQGQTQGRGILSETFRLMLDKHARHAAFAGWEQQEKAKLSATQNTALQGRFAAAKAAQAAKLAVVRTVYDRDRAALITRQDSEKARIRDGWKRIYADREKAAQLARHADQSRERVARQNGQNYRHGRRLDRATRPPIDSQAKAPGQTVPTPQQQRKEPVKPDFSRASQLPIANQSPEPMHRMSVPVPTPAPTPAGVPVPPARRMDPVPESDRAAAYAATPEGQKATAPQKAAPDALRRAFQPPPAQSPAARSEAPERLSMADFRRNAAAAKPQDAQQEQPRMSMADFRKNAAEVTASTPTPAAEQTRSRKPRR